MNQNLRLTKISYPTGLQVFEIINTKNVHINDRNEAIQILFL